jgi:hypothetical protein
MNVIEELADALGHNNQIKRVPSQLWTLVAGLF